MPHDPGERDPGVAVEERRAGRPRGGVVVHAGALDAGAVAGRGAVVQGEEQALARGLAEQRQQRAGQQARGQGLGASAGGSQGVVGGAEGVGDAGGAEPGGDGAAAAGEQGAAQQAQQPRGGAPVQGSDEVGEPGRQHGRQVRE